MTMESNRRHGKNLTGSLARLSFSGRRTWRRGNVCAHKQVTPPPKRHVHPPRALLRSNCESGSHACPPPPVTVASACHVWKNNQIKCNEPEEGRKRVRGALKCRHQPSTEVHILTPLGVANTFGKNRKNHCRNRRPAVERRRNKNQDAFPEVFRAYAFALHRLGLWSH